MIDKSEIFRLLLQGVRQVNKFKIALGPALELLQ